MVNLLQVWDTTSSNTITVLKTKLINLSTNDYYVLINQVFIQTFTLDDDPDLQSYYTYLLWLRRMSIQIVA